MSKDSKRTIRRLMPDDMDTYVDIYLNAYPAGKDISKECYDKYYNRNMQSLLEYEHVNFFGLFEDDELISIMKLIDFDINLFGKMNKATGLMSLAVHPLHKKKGVARDMVKFFEDYTISSGGLCSMLLPFRIEYYRKMGYGYGTKLDEYRIPTLQLSSCKDISNLRLIKKDEIDKVISCYSSFVSSYHGAVCKFEEEIREINEDDETRRIGYFEAEELKGYAAFCFTRDSEVNYTLNSMIVSELVYSDGEVLKKLLAGLRMQADLAQNIVIRTGEADFYHLLDSPEDTSGNYINYGFIQTNISAMGNMYKIPDIKSFVEKTSYRKFPVENIKIGFTVYDEFKGENNSFAILFTPNELSSYSSWSFESENIDSDLEIKIKLSDLSALFMGSADFAPMVRLGIVSISDKNLTEKVDRLFHLSQRPFTNTDY